MAVMLPPEVSGLLQLLGYEWPEGNEDRVMEMAAGWQSFASALDAQVDLGELARQHVVAANEGPAIEAFGAAFADLDTAGAVTRDLGTGSVTIGGCLYVMAGAIITLKVVVVIQLVFAGDQHRPGDRCRGAHRWGLADSRTADEDRHPTRPERGHQPRRERCDGCLMTGGSAGRAAAKKLIGLIAKAVPPGTIRTATKAGGSPPKAITKGEFKGALPVRLDLRDFHLSIPAKDLIARGRRYKGSGRPSRVKNHFPETAGSNEVLYKTDRKGKVTYYQLYDRDGIRVTRVDIDPVSKPHNNIKPPHTQEYVIDRDPKTGRIWPKPGKVREVYPIELEGLDDLRRTD